jgi:hypothetical protein
VSEDRDPPRLGAPGSGASPEARALLDVLRADRPDPAHLARLARRLPRGGGAPPAAPPAASLIPSALLGAGLGLVVVGGAWLGGAMRAPPAAAPVPVASAPATGAPLAETATPAQAHPPREPRPGASPAARPGVSPSAAAVASPAGAPPANAPSAESSAAAVAGLAPVGDGDLSGPGAVTEVELVQRAQRALAGAPALALAAAEEHRRRFPGGALAQEREVIAVSALVGLGRRDEARARATRFVEGYPGSVHRRGVEALVPGIASGGSDHKSDADRRPTP